MMRRRLVTSVAGDPVRGDQDPKVEAAIANLRDESTHLHTTHGS
jgi:hypothetical protein